MNERRLPYRAITIIGEALKMNHLEDKEENEMTENKQNASVKRKLSDNFFALYLLTMLLIILGQFYSFQPLYFILLFAAVFIQSSAEEWICRGFLYQRLIRSYKSPAAASVGNAFLFTALHLMNDGVTVLSVLNIFLTGIMFSLIIYYVNSIWCAMAVHTAWNFTQNILFGLPNSGLVVPWSIFRLDVSTAKNSFAYNVGFGIEGTIFADIVLVLACAGIYLWGRKNGKKPDDIWNEYAADGSEPQLEKQGL